MSDNIFQEVLTDAKGVEERLLGPSYPYYKNIKTPSDIGMSDRGTISQMARDIDGLIQYVELLVSGNSNASATGRPLGNQFFLQTGAKCADINKCSDPNDSSTCEKVNRYIYVNNIPEGNIPFISSGLGVNFSEFKGLIPGAMGNLNVLSPYAIMSSFLSGSTPACQEITMQTVDVNNNRSTETHYVTLADVGNMDACSFPNRKNPVTGANCKETFTNSGAAAGVAKNAAKVLPQDFSDQLYLVCLSAIGVYILYRMMQKS
jgi:hypothetical protein